MSNESKKKVLDYDGLATVRDEIRKDIDKNAIAFTEATTRTNIESGETRVTLFGKIKKWFTDLKDVAFSGSYSDLTDTPATLPNPNKLRLTINGSAVEYDGSSYKSPIGIYAPTDIPKAGQTVIRKSTGSTPVWKDPDYIVCSSTETTSSKTAILQNFVLVTGATVRVKFNNANSADDATLNIDARNGNSSAYVGAKPIYYKGRPVSAINSWDAGEILDLVYDGTNWITIGSNRLLTYQTCSDCNNAVEPGVYICTMANNSPAQYGGLVVIPTDRSSDDLSTATLYITQFFIPDGSCSDENIYTRYSSGLDEDGSAIFSEWEKVGGNQVSYIASCSTKGDVAAKTIDVPNFELVKGARVLLDFAYKNTVASNVTMNVSGTGAKPLYYGGSPVNNNIYVWEPYGYCEMFYDGEKWQIISETWALETLNSLAKDLGIWDAPYGCVQGYQILKYLDNASPATFNAHEDLTLNMPKGNLLIDCKSVVYNDSNTITDGTNSWYSPTTAGSSGQWLKSSGSGNPSWVTPSNLTLSMNGSSSTYNTNSAVSKTWYAPTSAGTAGHELISNGSGAPIWKAPSFAICSTPSSTVAKTVTISNFKLAEGATVRIAFDYPHTNATRATLNVSNTGAKSIYYKDALANASNSWVMNEVVDFVYDGIAWYATGSSQMATQSDIANADSGVVFGAYTGDGEASRFIDLGFTPVAVEIYRADGSQVSDGSGSSVNYSGGFALSGAPCYTLSYKLIEISGNGFTISNGRQSNSINFSINATNSVYYFKAYKNGEIVQK